MCRYNEPLNPTPDDFFYGDADIEDAELRAAGREYDRRSRRMRALREAGRLEEAAAACLHGWGYPLASPAAVNNGDPRSGEEGYRCNHCGSVLTELGDLAEVLHPCDWLPGKENA